VLKALNEERRALAAEAVEQAERISRRWEKLHPEYAEDLRETAIWALMRAASSYNLENECEDAERASILWGKWLKRCVDSESLNFLRSTYLRRRVLATQDALEAIVDDRDIEEEADCTDAVNSLLARLTRRQREICELVYLRGMTPHSAGKTMGIRPENACRLHREAIERLRGTKAA
jgi:RNA polymerase sigma factor (sigma-70 family)